MNSALKILFLQEDFPPAAKGGAGAVAFELARAMKAEGHDVSVITATQVKEEEGELEYGGLKIFRVYSRYPARFRAYLSLYNPRTVGKIKKILNKVRPDVVHAHNIHYYLSYHALKLARRSGAKVYMSAHDVMLFHYGKLKEFIDQRNPSCEVKSYKISAWRQMLSLRTAYNPLRNIIIKYYLHYVDKIFAVSEALKTALEHNGMRGVEVIHNGIDTEQWTLDQSILMRFKAQYGLEGKKIILFGGRLTAAKGGREALLAMAETARELPEAVLLVMGDRSGYAQEMAALAKKLDLTQSLLFTGWISGAELRTAYHASNVVLAPSICFDSLPTVVLEAMACKKPVVATCFGGAKEMIMEGETGFIVNPFDTHTIAQKLILLLSDSVQAEEFGKRGFERVKKEFSLIEQTQKYLAEFEK